MIYLFLVTLLYTASVVCLIFNQIVEYDNFVLFKIAIYRYQSQLVFFQKQGTPCCLGAASSCLLLPGLTSACFVWVLVICNISYFVKEIWISVNDLHICTIPRNQYHFVLQTDISIHGSGLFWAKQDKARGNKKRQGDALRQLDKRRRMSPSFANTAQQYYFLLG